MHRIGLLFELRLAETRPGESVQVVGNWPTLGNWREHHDGSSNCLLQCFQSKNSPHPTWSMRLPLWIDVPCNLKEIVVEYKFVRNQRGLFDSHMDHFMWEEDIDSRRVSLPLEDGSMWIISDARWNSNDEGPTVTCARLSKVLSRLGSSDPDAQLEIESAAPADIFQLTPRSEDDDQNCCEEADTTHENRKYSIEEVFRALSPPRTARDNPKESIQSNRVSARHSSWPSLQEIDSIQEKDPADNLGRQDALDSESDGSDYKGQQGQGPGHSMTISGSPSVDEENSVLREEIKMLRERVRKLEAAHVLDYNANGGTFEEPLSRHVPCKRESRADGNSSEVGHTLFRQGAANDKLNKSPDIQEVTVPVDKILQNAPTAVTSDHNLEEPQAEPPAEMQVELTTELTELPVEATTAWQSCQFKSPHVHVQYFDQMKQVEPSTAGLVLLPL